MAPLTRGVLVVLLLAVLGFLLSTRLIDYPFLAHRGQALDWRTKQPIGGVTIRIACYKSRTFHGSDLVRNVFATSAQDGSYRFAPGANRGCSYIGVHPERAGYIDLHDADLNVVSYGMSAEMPKFVWLVAEGDRKRLRLEALLSNSKAQRISPPGPMPVEDYATVARPLAESSKLATEPADIEWLRANYCDRLRALREEIPPAERGRAAQIVSWGATSAFDVEQFCAGAAPATVN